MERRRGIVVRHEEPLQLANHPEARRRVSEALVDTLADLHAIDVTAPPLAALGKPAGFVGRQVARLDRALAAREDRRRARDGQLATWLRERLPPDPVPPSVVHGDFKLDNVLLDPLDPAASSRCSTGR